MSDRPDVIDLLTEDLFDRLRALLDADELAALTGRARRAIECARAFPSTQPLTDAR